MDLDAMVATIDEKLAELAQQREGLLKARAALEGVGAPVRITTVAREVHQARPSKTPGRHGETRGEMVASIGPSGATPSELAKVVGVDKSTAAYHLRLAKTLGEVRAVGSRMTLRYYRI